MRRVARLLSVAGTALACAAGAAPAYAEAPPTGLAAPTRISGDTARIARSADVAVNADGQAVAGWPEVPLDQPGQPKSTGAMVSFRSAAGAWSAPQRVSDPAYNASRVRVAIDSAGTATIAWTEAPDDHRDVVHVVRHSGAGLADPQAFVPPAGGAESLDLAVNSGGDAILAWSARDPCDVCGSRQGAGSIWGATRAGDTPFGDAQQLSDPASTFRASAVASIDVRGDAAVGWEEGPTDDIHVLVRQRQATGAFAAPVDLPVGHVAGAVPGVLVAPSGETTVTWWQERAMTAARLGPDGSVRSKQLLAGSYATQFAFGRAALAADDAGRVTAAWIANDGVWAASAEPGADLGPGVQLDPYASTSAGAPGLGVDPAGGAVVAWVTDNALRAAWRPVGEPAFRPAGTIRSGTVASDAGAALAGGHLLLTAAFGSSSDALGVYAAAGAPAAIAPPAPIAAAPVADTTAPTLTISAASVVKKRLTKRSGRRVTSRTLQLVARSSEPAQVVVSLAKRVAGVRRGKSCVARPHGRSHKKAKSCRRTVTVGKRLRTAIPAGSTTLKLGSAPPRGTYELVLIGTDAVGNRAVPATRRLVIR